MRLKKLKRLLSLTLSAAMVASMLSVPVRAEGLAATAVPALETAEKPEDVSEKEATEEPEAPTEGITSKEDAVSEDTKDTAPEESGENSTPEETGQNSVLGEAKQNSTPGKAEQDSVPEETGEGEAAAPVVNTPAEATGTGTKAPVIVGGVGTDAKTLAEALKTAQPGDIIELAGNVVLTGGTYDLSAKNAPAEATEGTDPVAPAPVTVKTNGHMITINKGDTVSLTGGVFENETLGTHLMFHVNGTLNIHGGTYRTKGSSVLSILGEAVIDGDASFISEVDENAIKDMNYYDGKALIDVNAATAKLTMKSGSISAKTGNMSGTKDFGMYGIYVNNGGQAVLGETTETENGISHTGPTIESMFAAVGMNYTASPGRITIEGGTYRSYASCTKEAEKKFNAVLYLPASASVTINGGTFESKSELPAESSEAPVVGNAISIPYVKPKGHDTYVRLNLTVNGGTFKHAGDGEIFYGEGVTGTGSKVKVNINGGSFSKKFPDGPSVIKIDPEYSLYPTQDGYEVQTAGVAHIGEGASATRYTTLAKAVEAATAANASDRTIHLEKDIVLEDDLNLSGAAAANDTAASSDASILTHGHTITIPEGAKVTLTAGTNSKITNDLAVNGTIPANGTVPWGEMTNAERKTILSVEDGGELELVNGTYQSKGVYLLYTAGKTTITGAKLACITPTGTESDANADILSTLRYYDGASVVVAEGYNATLTMPSGSITSKVANPAQDSGMYGIYLKKGATVDLGTESSQAAGSSPANSGPAIDTVFPAVAMNGLNAPGTIKIKSGTYTSSVSCPANLANFNAVIYLPASANVEISGGTFTATGSSAAGNTVGPRHVISIPYNVIEKQGIKVKVDLVISGGTFNVQNANTGNTSTPDAIFYDEGMKGETPRNRILIKAGTFNPAPAEEYIGCRQYMTDEGGNCTISDSITGTNHKFIWIPEQESTCWEEGVAGHYECLSCHEMASCKEPTTAKDMLSAKDLVTPKKEHTGAGVQPTQRVEPSCTKPGKKSYVQCPNCHLCYDSPTDLASDKTGKNGKPATDEHWILPKTGHRYTAAQFRWPAKFDTATFDGSDFVPGTANGVTAIKTCANCSADTDGHTLSAKTVSVTLAPAAGGENNGDGENTPNAQTETETKYPWEGRICTQALDVTFTATAEFEYAAEDKDFQENNTPSESRNSSEESNLSDGGNAAPSPVTATDSKEVKIPAKAHAYTKTDVTFDWNQFDLSSFEEGKTNHVTATGKCPVCGALETADAVTVTCTSSDKPTAGTAPTCSKIYTFTATATFHADAAGSSPDLSTSVTSEAITRTGTHQLELVKPFKAPTCTATGQWGYFQCQTCHKCFYGEDSAANDDYIGKDKNWDPQADDYGAKVAAETISEPIAHEFEFIKCAWTGTGNTADDVTATFRCINCKNKLLLKNGADADAADANTEHAEGTIQNITFETPTTTPSNASCGDKVTTTYPIIVKLDRRAVQTEETGEGENKRFTLTYQKSEEKVDRIAEYKDIKLTKSHTQKHTFQAKDVKVTWEDTAPTPVTPATTPGSKDSSPTHSAGDLNHYYDTTKGIRVEMTCSGCHQTVVFVQGKGILDSSDGNDMEDISVAIVPVIVAGSKPANCQEDGTLAYDVRVKYDNYDGSNDYHEVDFTQDDGTEQLPRIQTALKQDPTKHTWGKVEWGSWTRATETVNGKDIPKNFELTETAADGSTKTYTLPSYEITGIRHCMNSKGETKCTETIKAKASAGDTPTPSDSPYLDIKVHHREKTCTVNGRTTYDATFYNADGTPAEGPSPQYIYNEDSPGHQFTVNWDWDWEPDSAVETQAAKYVSLKVTRSCTVCGYVSASYEVEFKDSYLEQPAAETTAAETANTETDIPERRVYVSKDPVTNTPHNPNVDPNTDEGKGLRVVVSGKEPSCTEGGNVKYEATVKFNGENILTGEKEIKRGAVDHEFHWVLYWTDHYQEPGTAKDAETPGTPVGKFSENRYTLVAKRECVRGDQPASGNDIKEIAVAYTSTEATCVAKDTYTWKPTATAENDNWTAIQADATATSVNKGNLERTASGTIDPNNHNIANPTITWGSNEPSEDEATKGQTRIFVDLSGTCSNEGCTAGEQSLHIQAKLAAATAESPQKDLSCTEDTNLLFTIPSVEENPALKGWNIPNDERTKKITIQKTGHYLNYIEGTPVTCTTAGTIEHFHCTKCGNNYKSPDALNPITVTNQPLGHQYSCSDDYVTFTWTNEEKRTAEARFECTRKNCAETEEGHFRTFEATVGNGLTIKEADCEGITNPQPGSARYAVSVKIQNTGTEDNPQYPEGFRSDGTAESSLPLTIPAGGPHRWDNNGICKCCHANQNETVQVTFHDRNQNVLSTKSYQKPADDGDYSITVPTPPSVLGQIFKGWKLTGDSNADALYTTDVQIAAAVKAATKDSQNTSVVFTASYDAQENETARVRIAKKLDGTAETAGGYTTVPAGDYLSSPVSETYSAGEKTYRFSHWEIAVGDGYATVGTNLACSIRLQAGEEVTLYACYTTSSDAEVKPTVTMTAISAIVENDVKKLAFTSNAVLPEGCELVENGMLYILDPNVAFEDEKFVWSPNLPEGLKKLPFGNKVNNTLRIKRTEDNLKETVRIRPYLRYKDTTGEIHVVYGDLIKTSYEDLSNQGSSQTPAAK